MTFWQEERKQETIKLYDCTIFYDILQFFGIYSKLELLYFQIKINMSIITPSIAEININSDWSFTDLDHLKTIEPDSLRSIINGSWGILSLNGLGLITPEIAMILSRHKGILSLNGIASLGYESAIHLVGHQGTLLLKGIKTLDKPIAELFSLTDETIILGLESVNDQVAHILAHPHGVIGFSAQVAERVRTLVEIN